MFMPLQSSSPSPTAPPRARPKSSDLASKQARKYGQIAESSYYFIDRYRLLPKSA